MGISVDSLKDYKYNDTAGYIDPEELELRQRLDDEWAAVEATRILRFEHR